jgi:hypothetical protein
MPRQQSDARASGPSETNLTRVRSEVEFEVARVLAAHQLVLSGLLVQRQDEPGALERQLLRLARRQSARWRVKGAAQGPGRRGDVGSAANDVRRGATDSPAMRAAPPRRASARGTSPRPGRVLRCALWSAGGERGPRQFTLMECLGTSDATHGAPERAHSTRARQNLPRPPRRSGMGQDGRCGWRRFCRARSGPSRPQRRRCFPSAAPWTLLR